MDRTGWIGESVVLGVVTISLSLHFSKGIGMARPALGSPMWQLFIDSCGCKDFVIAPPATQWLMNVRPGERCSRPANTLWCCTSLTDKSHVKQCPSPVSCTPMSRRSLSNPHRCSDPDKLLSKHTLGSPCPLPDTPVGLRGFVNASPRPVDDV